MMAMIGGIMRGKEPKRFSFALERLGVGNTLECKNGPFRLFPSVRKKTTN